MKTGLTQSHFLVTPGQSTRVEIEVTNTAEVIDGVTAIIDGINPDWVRLERPMLSLFPESSERLAMVFDIPPDCPAGDYLIVVRIVSTIDLERESVHDFWLTVGVVAGVDLALRPTIVTGGAEAVVEATITNTGNSPATITIEAIEPTRAVDCTVDPSSIVLSPASPAILPITLRGPRPWFGQPAVRQVHITAQVDDLVVERIATFNQKPRIPRGLLTALMLAGIILLWAFIFLWVINEMRNSEPVAKATGTYLIGGPANIPLAAIAATFEGTVTAETTGEGLPRITVEAVRVTADGEPISAASAATNDDGTYAIPSLVPGDYAIRFSAEGFEPVRYVDEDGNDLIPVGPTEVLEGVDAVLVGELGRITGQIALPAGSEQIPLGVTARMVVEQSTGEVSDEPAASQITTDGSINLEGLPTPATYVVSVGGEGFATQTFEQTVGGGQSSVINTVNLAAAAGMVEGYVVDGNGTRLGGVQVTARTGTTELKAVTPTTGDVGHFVFVDLATPETYVLTFQAAGFSSETKSLQLEPGRSATVSATLVGGSGTVTGSAMSPTGTPLGGITVKVTGEAFSGQTTTLTTSGTGGAAGSFTIAGLPVPGSYTITFSGTGVQNETLGAGFLAAGVQDLGNVTLLPLTAQVGGTVRSGGTGLGEVTVTLTDGELSQVTTSATNPAGQYSFANVPAGAYTVTFARTGYRTQVLLVQVAAGVDTTADANLVAGS